MKIPFSQAVTPWMMGIGPVDFRDKPAAVQAYVRYMLDRTNRMIKVNGLPESIPEYILKMMVQANGHCIVAHVDGQLYALTGTWSGFPDPYYRGTEYVVANPGLDMSRTFKPGEDCVVIRNDHAMLGLVPMCNHYASMLVETDLSLTVELVTGRAPYIIGAGNDADKLAADDFIRKLWSGDLSAVLENRFIDGLKVAPASEGSSQRLSQLIEAHQFISAKWYNALGLDSNYNMKRESLTANEVDMNSDSLMPLVDDMLDCWQTGVEEVNEMFGTSWSVELSSSWKDNDEQIHGDPEADPQQPEEGENNEPTD